MPTAPQRNWALMLSQLGHRLITSVPVLLGVLLLGFLLMQLIPGDVARVIAGPTATQDVIDRIRLDLGLDRPLFVQFASIWRGCCRATSATP